MLIYINSVKKLKDLESMNQILAENKKLQSDIAIVKSVNHKLEDKIFYLEKNQAKVEQYSRRNNVKISGIQEHSNKHL